MMARLKWYLDPPYPHQLIDQNKKQSKLDPFWHNFLDPLMQYTPKLLLKTKITVQ